MAKGLFSVYQDDENVSITIKSKQQQQIKRKVLDSTSTSTSKNGKENSNSFGSDKSKGIIPGMKKKPLIHCGEKSTTSQTSTRSFLAPAPLSLTSKSVNSNTTTMKILPTIKGGNGICTGTLRTKEVNFPIYDSTSDITHINLPPLAVHSDVLILRESSSSTGMNSVNNSPSSAKDSGYASTSRSGNESNTSFGSGSGSESDMDLVEEDEVDKTIKFESEGDRRARALTESPLAEITQAYNPFGNFSLSPTPIINSQTFSNRSRFSPHRSPSRTASKSASASQQSAISKPYEYSTTATTRKVKPTTSTEVVVEKEMKSLRI